MYPLIQVPKAILCENFKKISSAVSANDPEILTRRKYGPTGAGLEPLSEIFLYYRTIKGVSF